MEMSREMGLKYITWWKNRFKHLFLVRILIVGFVLALVGWFILWVEAFGRFFEDELLDLERIVETSAFTWGLRIFVLAMVVLLLIKNRWLTSMWEKKTFRYMIYIVFTIGLTGWLTWGIGLVV